jgi:hypothetical protein
MKNAQSDFAQILTCHTKQGKSGHAAALRGQQTATIKIDNLMCRAMRCANEPSHSGNIGFGGLPWRFLEGRCPLAVLQSLELEQARTGYPAGRNPCSAVPQIVTQSAFQNENTNPGSGTVPPYGAYPTCWPRSPRWNAAGKPGTPNR